jgi:hypothetical protein
MPLKHSDEISPQDFWNIRKTNSARRVRLVGFKTLCRRYPLLLAEGIRELALVLIFVLFCESYGFALTTTEKLAHPKTHGIR